MSLTTTTGGTRVALSRIHVEGFGVGVYSLAQATPANLTTLSGSVIVNNSMAFAGNASALQSAGDNHVMNGAMGIDPTTLMLR